MPKPAIGAGLGMAGMGALMLAPYAALLAAGEIGAANRNETLSDRERGEAVGEAIGGAVGTVAGYAGGAVAAGLLTVAIKGALAGAKTGGAIGSVVPVLGTAVGATAGLVLGAGGAMLMAHAGRAAGGAIGGAVSGGRDIPDVPVPVAGGGGGNPWSASANATMGLSPFADPSMHTRQVNDMILTPAGTFSTHPDDYIIAMKDPAALVDPRVHDEVRGVGSMSGQSPPMTVEGEIVLRSELVIDDGKYRLRQTVKKNTTPYRFAVGSSAEARTTQ